VCPKIQRGMLIWIETHKVDMPSVSMGKTYRSYLPEQDLLSPAGLWDWLPKDHQAYLVSDMVPQLDLRALESVYEEEERVQPRYHPRMMTKILIYEYYVAVFSSRLIQKKLSEDVGFQVSAARNESDFRTISDFRKLHLGALQGLFDQVLQIALQAGTMKLGRVGVGLGAKNESRADAGIRKSD
jgi:transposase